MKKCKMEIIEIVNSDGGKEGKGVLFAHEFDDYAGDIGEAITLREGEPYIGLFGEHTHIDGAWQKYAQVWAVTYDGDGTWIGFTCSNRQGNNWTVSPDDAEFSEAVEFGLAAGLEFTKDPE